MAPARILPALATLLLLTTLVPAPADASDLCVVRNPGSPRCIIDGGVISGGDFTGVRISEWKARMVCAEGACTPWIVYCVGVGVWVDGREIHDTGNSVCELVP